MGAPPESTVLASSRIEVRRREGAKPGVCIACIATYGRLGFDGRCIEFPSRLPRRRWLFGAGWILPSAGSAAKVCVLGSDCVWPSHLMAEVRLDQIYSLGSEVPLGCGHRSVGNVGNRTILCPNHPRAISVSRLL